MRRHAQDAVSVLRVEHVSLFLDAAKGVHYRVKSKMVIVAEIYLVPNYISIVIASFSVPLVEPALVLIRASAMFFFTLQQHVGSREGTLKESVDMGSAVSFGAVFGARNGRY